jgi:hypothetical protein
MHGQDLGRRLNPEERAERLGGFAVDAAGTFIAGGVLRGGGGKGTAVRGTNPSPTGPKFKSWNDFQAGTKGQFKSRAEAAKAWIAYKEANGITTGTVRSQAVKRQFLISMSRNPNTPSWMKPWLSRGQVPPGYQVDHINPLSIGGPDIPSNMRLQGIDLHKLHHFHYHPWRTP